MNEDINKTNNVVDGKQPDTHAPIEVTAEQRQSIIDEVEAKYSDYLHKDKVTEIVQKRVNETKQKTTQKVAKDTTEEVTGNNNAIISELSERITQMERASKESSEATTRQSFINKLTTAGVGKDLINSLSSSINVNDMEAFPVEALAVQKVAISGQDSNKEQVNINPNTPANDQKANILKGLKRRKTV